MTNNFRSGLTQLEWIDLTVNPEFRQAQLPQSDALSEVEGSKG